MASRKGTVLSIADGKSEALIESLPEGTRARQNMEAIRSVCRSLVSARTPVLPTAPLICERGALKNAQFPTEQTIYNSYRGMLQIWRKAYHDTMNLDAAYPMTADEVSMIDTSLMESSDAFIVERLKEIVFELTQRCNALKRIIDESVPVPAGNLSEDASGVMQRLKTWIRSMDDGVFTLDEFALKVSRRTPVGTRIMDADLFNELSVFVDDYENIGRARKA